MPSRTRPLYHQLPVWPSTVSVAPVAETEETLSVLLPAMSGVSHSASPVAFVLLILMSSVLVLSSDAQL